MNGQTLTVNGTGTGFLTLGYEDDNYRDNGYKDHDDGPEDQCKGKPNAYVTITVTPAANADAALTAKSDGASKANAVGASTVTAAATSTAKTGAAPITKADAASTKIAEVEKSSQEKATPVVAAKADSEAQTAVATQPDGSIWTGLTAILGGAAAFITALIGLIEAIGRRKSAS